MTTISKQVFCRAGLLGNPSDGYGGKTISVIVKEFSARVTLRPDNQISLVPGPEENPVFDSVYQLTDHLQQVGYFGGLRLIKATIKRFVEFAEFYLDVDCQRGFSIDYRSNIPRSVGLAGSSAIVVATLEALAEHYHATIEPAALASLALSVETDELKIPAGLQDRVIQVMEGIVFMDFSRMKTLQGMECGQYSHLACPDPFNLYIAFSSCAAEPTEAFHGNLKSRFEQGDSRVTDAMLQFAELAEQGRDALNRNDLDVIANLIDANFDLRNQICDINPLHQKMIDTARSAGASAKFCGSGGAIIGTYNDHDSFLKLVHAMQQIDCKVFKPTIL